jgi:hypothetical protein
MAATYMVRRVKQILNILGMFLEGAKWNYDKHLIDVSIPKELYIDIPLVWFCPLPNRKIPESVTSFNQYILIFL